MKKTVFTNGVFDGPHPGHLRLLQWAAGLGRLIVGINSDASTRRLKGPGRPIFTESERYTMVAAIRWVDSVYIFDEDTPEHLIEQVRPDYLVKGPDYAGQYVVGAAFVRSYGGRLIIADHLAKDVSTTDVLDRIIQLHRESIHACARHR